MKSTAIATRLNTNAIKAVIDPARDPTTPGRIASKKAMNAMAQATGWRTMARVSPSAVLEEAAEKSVPSDAATT